MQNSVGTSRKISPCIMRYMASGFAMPFICSLLGFVALFMLVDVFDDMSDFLSKNVPAHITILYFLAKQPANLTNVFPVAALLGASFMTLMLGRHNELTAMRAAGMSLFTCNLPVWVISIIACLTVFAINESWGPMCSKKAASIEAEYVSKKVQNKRIAFHHPRAKRDWIIENLSTNESGVSTGIIVRQYLNNDEPEYMLTALNASYSDGQWTFQNGFIQNYSPDKKLSQTMQEFFDMRTMPFSESPSDISTHSLDWELMNIKELFMLLKSRILTSRKDINMVKVLIWHRLTIPIASLIGALFGVALTISTDRMGLMRGFAMAVGILVMFYVVGELFLVLAKNSWIPPFIGGALPSLVFLFAAIATMLKKS